MPIIAATGRRFWKVRVLIYIIYALLVIGSLTMLYPFGMMLSMSVSSNCDNMEQQLIPRYIKEGLTGGPPDALFRKYASIRYPKIEDFNRRHRSRYVDYSYGLKGRTATGIYARFQRIRPVPFDREDERFKQLTDDILAFKTWYSLGNDPSGVMPNDEGHVLNMVVAYRTLRSQNTLNPVLDRYVEWLKAEYGTLAKLNEEYREENQSWSDVMMPVERPEMVTWLPDTRSVKVLDFERFKDQLAKEDINFLLFADLNYHTLFSREYNSEERYQRQAGKWINTFYELKAPPEAPSIVIPHERFRSYLRDTFGSLDVLNTLYGVSFQSWEDISFPTPQEPNETALPLLSTFIRYALEQKTDGSFRTYLKEKYSEQGSFKAAYGIEMPSPADVVLPLYRRARTALIHAEKKPKILASADAAAYFLRTLREPIFGIEDGKLEAALLSEFVHYADSIVEDEAAAEREAAQKKAKEKGEEVDEKSLDWKDPDSKYRSYFKDTFQNLDVVNHLFGTSFESWEALALPEPDASAQPSLPLLGTFLLHVRTAASNAGFQSFIAGRYETSAEFEARYGVGLPDVSGLELPHYRSVELVLSSPLRTVDTFTSVENTKELVHKLSDPTFGITDAVLKKALLNEMLEFAYKDFCTKEQDLWVEFVRNNCPLRFLTINNVEEKYREYLKAKYKGNIDRLLSVYRQGLPETDLPKVAYKSFDDVAFPGDVYPRNEDGTFFFHRPFADDALAFVKSDFLDPLKDVTIATPEYWWGRYLEKKYGSLEGADEQHSYRFTDFNEVLLTAEMPRRYPQVLQDLWYEFVSTVLPLSEIRLSKGNLTLFQNYLRDVRYNGDIAALNKACGTHYADFDEVDFPDENASEAAGAEGRAFLSFRGMNPYEVYVRNPEAVRDDFHGFLLERLGSVEKLNAACSKYKDLSAPPIPYDELEWRDFNEYWTQKQGLFNQFLFGNYRVVVDFLTLHGRALLNTFVFCLASILIHTTINPMCAYALSRFRLTYGHYILLFLLATMSFPPMVTMIPNFLMLKSLGLLNTYWALVLPGAANGYSIFLLKGFFDSLPQELFEAGIIDGATEVQMFYWLAMPLSYPILAVIALWAFTGAYGAFMFAFIVCQDPKLWTLMVFLYEFQQEHATQLTMAALTLASIPTLLVFILAQRVILRGIVIPQMK